MAVDKIDRLYEIYEILTNAGDKIEEFEQEYIALLDSVKGTDKEKRLASQFIPKFFKSFPKLLDRTIESQFDLIEDDDVLIRKQAIRELPIFCKENKDSTKKIADILAQLLQVADTAELAVVYTALMNIIKSNAKGTFEGLFNQILTGDEIIRDRCIKFLASKYSQFGSDIVTKEVEDYVIAEVKNVLQDVTADEFRILMTILGMTRLGKLVTGHQELVNLVGEQAEIDKPFGAPDPENLDRLIACARHALPYFSSQVEASKFVVYMCDEVIPVISDIPEKIDENNADVKLEILKLFAELCSKTCTLDDAEKQLGSLFQKLLDYMPLPPQAEEGQSESTDPKLEFSYVECLLYSFHRLGRQNPNFLAENPDRLKDFRIRLQYFARGTQGYMKKLKELLNKSKTGTKEADAERALQTVALKTTSNILVLIKDLFHTPPSYKSVISLSWVAPGGKDEKNGTSVGLKRHTPITFDNGVSPKSIRTDKNDRVLYQPPSGKYSEKITNYGPPRRGGGGFRGRGRSFRGNRTWRKPSY